MLSSLVNIPLHQNPNVDLAVRLTAEINRKSVFTSHYGGQFYSPAD